MKRCYILLFICLCCTLTACLNSVQNEYAVSDDATVASMRFASNDTMPGLAAATFIIEERLDTGLIHNIDSIMYGTRVDKAIPIFSFNATPAAAILYTPNDTVFLSVADTVDFTQSPIYLQVVASDNMHQKWYKIKVNVHQVDPDLFDWKQLATHVYPTDGAEQKAFELNDAFYIIVNNGLGNSLYRSDNAQTWQQVSITGLPDNCQVRNIWQMDNTLYYAAGDAIYTSTNATEWSKLTPDANIANLLFFFNEQIWGIAYDAAVGQYHFATSTDMLAWQLQEAIPANFPISDYAALTFQSASRRPRAMVVGGFSATGESLNTRWNVEYLENRGYTWTNFSIEQPAFRSLTGVSVIWYNKRFYLFGGADADNQLGDYAMLESVDEGMNWNIPDSAHNCLPTTYQLRSKSSVFVGSDNAIYIVGGQSRTAIFSDVYRGKLNSIDW